MIADTISHYRIISKLGAGGMGEVYLAEDTKLHRKVAVKILSAGLTRDKDRLRRFEQEAQAASALNHPNILTIHEIGSEGEIHFIGTEYINGDTLRQRLARSRMPIHEVLDVAVQVAAALSAAHSAGIVHRDIKPENIMVRPDGLAKVLDFGLAKLIERQIDTTDTEVPTAIQVLTDPGTVLGTSRYMSPEQARGQDVDPRTDIFSFGIVLYEMVAGCAPFTGGTTTDVILAIIDREPLPLSQHTDEVPPELERIVNKALRKDKEERYQTSTELLVDVKSLKKELEFEEKLKQSTSSDASSQSRRATGSGVVRAETAKEPAAGGEAEAARTASSVEYVLSEIKQHRKGAAVALAIFATIVAAIGFVLFRFIGSNKQAAPFQTMKITRLTNTGKVSTEAIAISPDGKYVVHVVDDAGQQSLWVKHIVTTSNVQIVPPANVVYRGLTFSHDGNYIYYVMSDKQTPFAALYQVAVLGGGSRKLMTNVDSPISFSPDGSRFAFVRRDEKALMIANTEGTGEQKLAGRKAGESWRNPAWSPDAKIIACGVRDSNSQDEYLVEVSVTDGTERPIAAQRWSRVRWIAWLSDGSGLVMSAADKESKLTQIWTLSYPRGTPRKITSDLSSYAGISLTADSNALVSVRAEREANIWIAPNGDASRAKQITFGSGNNYGLNGLCWTPDGKAVYSAGPLGNENIWITEPDGTGQRQLTVSAHASFDPSVSPDGRYIVFVSDRTGSSNIWRMDLDGSNLKQLTSSGNASQPTCSLDSRWVVYRISSEKSASLWKVSIDGGDALQLRDKNSIRPVISPDGKFIAYCYDEKPNSYKIAIISFEGGPPIREFDVLPDTNTVTLRWAPDGRALTYVVRRNGIANIWRQPLDGGPPIQLTDFKADEIFSFDWSRDGKQLACSRGADKSDVVLISSSK